LLFSIQYRETYLGKQDPTILNMYCQYYTLLDNINHQRKTNKENVKKMQQKM
jgi:hypothetical protein